MCKETKNKVLKKFIDLLQTKDTNSNQNIYHYTDCKGLKGIIENKNLFFSDIYFLNDKSERFYFYGILKEVFEAMYNNKELSKEFYYFLKERTKAVLSDNYVELENEIKFWPQYYTVSFSLASDSLLLWYYYAKSNDNVGYNIGFNKNNILTNFKEANKSDDIFYSGKILYDKKTQIDTIRKFLLESNELYCNKSDVQTEIGMALHTIALFFKHPGFSSEEEYRFILTPKTKFDNIDERLKYKISCGSCIPYMEIQFDASKTVSIYISPTQNPEFYKNNLRMFLKTNSVDTKIKNSTIPLRY